jgi:hypothetical protein
MQKVSMRAKALRLVAAGGVAAAVMLPSAAMAQDVATYGGGGTHPNEGGQGTGSGEPGTTAANNSTGGSLPFTGGDVIGLALIGAGAIVGGTALVRSGRKRVAEV